MFLFCQQPAIFVRVDLPIDIVIQNFVRNIMFKAQNYGLQFQSKDSHWTCPNSESQKRSLTKAFCGRCFISLVTSKFFESLFIANLQFQKEKQVKRYLCLQDYTSGSLNIQHLWVIEYRIYSKFTFVENTRGLSWA